MPFYRVRRSSDLVLREDVGSTNCPKRTLWCSGKIHTVDLMTMAQQTDFPLPANLPQPVDDGGADHLRGLPLPPLVLPSTAGEGVDLSDLPEPQTVVYCYPMTGVPGKPLPEGWDMIPGARGCTPQACGFRDHHRELSELKAGVYGLSTQTTEYQQEMAARLHLPCPVLSDAEFKFCDALRLPTFQINGVRLLKRLTMVVRRGRIEHVFYPVFPPNESALQVIRWLRAHPLQADPFEGSPGGAD